MTSCSARLESVAHGEQLGLRLGELISWYRAINDAAAGVHAQRLRVLGVELGAALTDFEGVLSGVPSYKGIIPMLGDAPAVVAPD